MGGKAEDDQSVHIQQLTDSSHNGSVHGNKRTFFLAAGDSHSSNGSSSPNKHTSSKTECQAGKEAKAVTPADLALREDICYQIFGDVGALVRDFSCAWDHKVVMHGRMYVTERRLCFYANFFGLEAKMSLRHEDIARCNKGNSAIFIPNVIVVQDKSGKDYVFRSFWDRDECHSLLERLRLGVEKEENIPDREVEAAAAVVTGGEDDGFLDTNQPGGDNGDGTTFTSSERNRVVSAPDAPGYGSVVNLALSQCHDAADSVKSSGSDRCRSPSPPAASGGARHPSSATRPQRIRANSLPPSSLPLSPNSSPPKAMTASSVHGHLPREKRIPRSMYEIPSGYSTAATAAAAAAVAASGGDAGRLGLAILGGEHDIPSPYRGRSQQLRHQNNVRRSPRHAAVITGAGRRGWGSTADGVASPPQPHKGNVNGSSTGSTVTHGASTAVSGAAGEAKGTVVTSDSKHEAQLPTRIESPSANTTPAEDHDNSNDSGTQVALTSRSLKVGTAATADHEAIVEVAPEDPAAAAAASLEGAGRENAEEGTEKEAVRGDRPALPRKGSSLWLWKRLDSPVAGERGGKGEDSRGTERKALNNAITSAPRQSEVATAEFPVSVREFYERFFTDDAPYGLPDFHMSRGDWEVDAGEWQTTVEDAKQEDENGRNACDLVGGKGLTRALRFKTPLHISFMSSPGQVRTLKRQRARFFGSEGCIVDTITTVEDRIPLSDNFHVEDRWVIRPAGADGQECTATVSWRCVWHKFTVIKGLIEGKCKSDVQSFNIAFLEGMRLHLLQKAEDGAAAGDPKRRLSVRSHSRRDSRNRDGSFEASSSSLVRRRLSYERFSEEDGSGGNASYTEVEEEVIVAPPRQREWCDRLSPWAHVFSICFTLYVAAFWVRYQLRDGGVERNGGRTSGPDLEPLFSEWGRSSLAMLDLRDETRQLSSDILQLMGRDPRGARSREAAITDDKSMLRRLDELEQKVKAMSSKTDEALNSLSATASRILQASTRTCPDATDISDK